MDKKWRRRLRRMRVYYARNIEYSTLSRGNIQIDRECIMWDTCSVEN